MTKGRRHAPEYRWQMLKPDCTDLTSGEMVLELEFFARAV